MSSRIQVSINLRTLPTSFRKEILLISCQHRLCKVFETSISEMLALEAMHKIHSVNTIFHHLTNFFKIFLLSFLYFPYPNLSNFRFSYLSKCLNRLFLLYQLSNCSLTEISFQLSSISRHLKWFEFLDLHYLKRTQPSVYNFN